MTFDVRKRVLEETRLFRKALPRLLAEQRGYWLVFRDGRVQSAHKTEDEAYRAGLNKFGRDGGHIVVQVVEQETAPVSAGVVFGLS